ncbi:MAG: NADAR family protein [Proteobacteria bacterium]|nr:NADAR family protein [Pseudomonadota bacterium]
MPFCMINQLDLFSFYDKSDVPAYSLANYSSHSVTIFDPLLKQNVNWPTTEHYFQAQKITNLAQRTKFIQDMKNKSPDACRTQVNQYQPHDPKWHLNNTKQKVMLEALRAKYDQHQDIQKLLKSTGNMPIVEDTAGASYVDNEWGCGYDGKGENYLGVLWMQVRAEKIGKKSSTDAEKEARALQQQAKTALIGLGTRKGQLLQKTPGVVVKNVGSTSQQATTFQSMLDLANDAVRNISPGQSFTVKGITYGVSARHKTFFIKGKSSRNNTYYDVYIDANGKTHENGKVVAKSGYVDWALNHVVPDYQSQFTQRAISSPNSIQQMDNLTRKMLKRGESITFKAGDKNQTEITYGISGKFDTFYIYGKGKNGKAYDISLRNGTLYENNYPMNSSKWFDWVKDYAATNMVSQYSNSNNNTSKLKRR